MILYFAPLACSMASRIALYEAGLPAEFREVVLSTKAVKGGGDFWAVNPKGQVPALALDDGRIVTEGPAVLQAIADMAPASRLAAAAGTPERTELQSWLNLIASELHSGGFYPQIQQQLAGITPPGQQYPQQAGQQQQQPGAPMGAPQAPTTPQARNEWAQFNQQPES